MENYETNSPSDKLQMKKHFQRFAEQLSEWFSTEKIPELASEDTRFALELQKQKLKSLGLNMQLLIENREGFSDSAAVLSYTDSFFVNSIWCNNKRITATIRDSQKELYSRTAPGILTVIMQNPKQGGVPSPDTAMCCPHCGAPSTLGKLESGCAFCKTRFLMDELYPKVMYFSISDYGDARFDTKILKKHIVCWSLFFLCISVLVMIIHLSRGQLEHNRLLYEIAGRTVASVMIGAMVAVSIWFITNIVGSVRLIGRQTRGASKVIKSVMFCNKMRKLDPTFSTEYFRDKSLSLLKLMLFSENPQELAVCRCSHPIPEKLREIVDIRCQNSGINSYSIRDGVCDVSITFYTDSLHFRSGKIHPKSDKIRLSLRKVINKPTNLAFSVLAVNCPSCGASFDAEKRRNCPFCGKSYTIEENEWVVTDISI